MLLAMAIVLLVTLLCGRAAQRLGQARVIGEMAGGILLGPSLLGRFAPAAAAQIFTPSVLSSFEVLSTLGLVLYLFLVGTDMDLGHLRQQRATASLTSLCSIVVPFGLAALLVPGLRTGFPAGSVSPVSPLAFALFLGVAMSITAFPVLARILEERGLTSTPLGATALLSAAVDDVAAWTLLAVALTMLPHVSTGSGAGPGVGRRLLWLGAYLVVMAVGATLTRRLVRNRSGEALSITSLGVAVVVALLSAFATDAIGVHPLFGAFLAGVCFPRVASWQQGLRDRLDTATSTVLLPFFFALTGMRTRLDLLNSPRIWIWTAVILAVAVAGKMGGAVLGARLTGESWRASLALGALLNTRGLVELIVLNIARNAGVFSPTLFTILVVMALATTAMTTPALKALRIPESGRRDMVRG
jgi:Kef-type K+ transport system membrane component KefB